MEKPNAIVKWKVDPKTWSIMPKVIDYLDKPL